MSEAKESSVNTPLVGEQKPQPGAAVLFMKKLNHAVMTGGYFGEAQGPFTVRQCINLHKLLVLPVYLGFIYYFGGDLSLSQQWGPAAAVLLTCHSSYGVLWCFKDIWYPDRSWQIPMNVLGFLTIFIYPLGLYYVPMFCLVSDKCPLGRFGRGNEPWLIALGLFFYIFGFFFHFTADLQKDVELSLPGKRKLITQRMFAHSRNPNYFGEICLYVGYAVLSTSYLPLLLFCVVWLQIFLPNMLAKEASMSRHAEWQQWTKRTGFVVPWLPTLVKEFCCNVLTKTPETKEN